MDVNDNDSNKTPGKLLKVKTVDDFNWADYLEACGAEAAPQECFTQNIEPPENEFELNQKLEITSADGAEFVHLATVVGKLGPRLQLRLDGCDNSNDFFELVDSDRIHPYGTSDRKGWFRAAPLRFRKDASGYRAFCTQVMNNGAVCAPERVFKNWPEPPKHNLFKVGQKLEAVDVKHPSNICPATIMKVENTKVEIHLDGWDHNNDYKCFHYSRNLFPVGWCRKAGHILQLPGPKDERKITKQKTELEVSSIKLENLTLPSDKNVKLESSTNKPAVDSSFSQSSKSSPVDKLHLNLNGTVPSSSSKSISPKLNNGVYSSQNHKPIVTTPSSHSKSSNNATPVHLSKTITIHSKNKSLSSLAANEKPKSSPSVLTPKSSSSSVTAFKPNSSSCTASKPSSSSFHKQNHKPNHKAVSVMESTKKPSNLTNGNSKKRDYSDVASSSSSSQVTKKKATNVNGNGFWFSQNINLIPPKEVVESWTPNNVTEYLMAAYPELKNTPFQEKFIAHEIDGIAFLLLDTVNMCKHLGLKLGHSLKIKNLVETILESKP